MKNGNGKYSVAPELFNSVSRLVTGQYASHAQLLLVEKAYEAADMYRGVSLLWQPTMVQCAGIWRINRTYVGWAVKRPCDRALVESGAVPLALPTTKALPPPMSPEEKLVDVVSQGGINGTHDLLVRIERARAAA